MHYGEFEMKASQFIDEEKLITRAIDILVTELGPIETGRFMSLPRKERIESVKRHRQWQSELDKDEFFNRVFGKD